MRTYRRDAQAGSIPWSITFVLSTPTSFTCCQYYSDVLHLEINHSGYQYSRRQIEANQTYGVKTSQRVFSSPRANGVSGQLCKRLDLEWIISTWVSQFFNVSGLFLMLDMIALNRRFLFRTKLSNHSGQDDSICAPSRRFS
ncbi:hypothetical protein SISSUDRAFT_118660 [Sistotremastrum suecicum HHB10207 ss-3]|uniref:Uncharacterized protein n=1 Tax=Sistotremastrum suecicum HHB10207 ss-3 TaxID=1314776 RepID=A0A166B280_9AGAM|nr:hypothetical protein SISSUDRAFT_118660 [Sistotremastrum suecicum HHB10207 ss-3]